MKKFSFLHTNIKEKMDFSRLPVLEKTSNHKTDFPKLIGWITHHDITRHYVSEKANATHQAMEEHIL
jgi:CBS domain-containing protein